MSKDNIPAIIEAVIFSSQNPAKLNEIASLFDNKFSEDELKEMISQLNSIYKKEGRSFRIDEVGEGWLFQTLPDYFQWIVKKDENSERPRLTLKGLETLAIIAYKQPITRTEIEAIRGVNSDYLLRQLLERNLITIMGRAQAPGQPLLYGTSSRFLKYFGLSELDDLPKLREIDELLQSDDHFLKKLNQFEITDLDPDKLGFEFVEKIKSVMLKGKTDNQDSQNEQE